MIYKKLEKIFLSGMRIEIYFILTYSEYDFNSLLIVGVIFLLGVIVPLHLHQNLLESTGIFRPVVKEQPECAQAERREGLNP